MYQMNKNCFSPICYENNLFIFLFKRVNFKFWITLGFPVIFSTSWNETYVKIKKKTPIKMLLRFEKSSFFIPLHSLCSMYMVRWQKQNILCNAGIIYFIYVYSIFYRYIHRLVKLYIHYAYTCAHNVRCALSIKQRKNGRIRVKSVQNENIQWNVSKWITRPRSTLIRIFQSQKFFFIPVSCLLLSCSKILLSKFLPGNGFGWFNICDIFCFLMCCGLMVAIESRIMIYRFGSYRI